jgi:hypothetical protein
MLYYEWAYNVQSIHISAINNQTRGSATTVLINREDCFNHYRVTHLNISRKNDSNLENKLFFGRK